MSAGLGAARADAAAGPGRARRWPPPPGASACPIRPRRPPEHGLTLAGVLAEPRGVFVTLTRDGALRGCIGTIVGRLPLAEAVVDAARNAAVGRPPLPAGRPRRGCPAWTWRCRC